MKSRHALNILLGTLLSLLLLLLSRVNVYIAPFLILFLGFNLSRLLFRDVSYRLAVSPAIGISLLAILAYALSLSGIGLKPLVYLIIVLSAISFNVDDVYNILHLDRSEKILLGKLILTVLLVVGVRAIVFKMPTDNVDNYFHATKVLYTLRYMTLFPPKVPVFNVFTYPAGYHSLVSFILMESPDLIPHAMLVVRLWSWAFIVLGTYLFASIWFERRVGLYSAMLILVTNIYTYYLLVYINPNFMGFYFFLTLLALFHLEVNNSFSEFVSLFNLRAFMVLIGAGALFVHPYEFQNWVFVLSAYLLLKILNKEISLRNAVLKEFVYVVPPLVVYAVLNPYFWWPELASKIVVEYPWASYVGVAVKNLSILKGKHPMDTWSKFYFLIRWVTIRNYNYLASLLLLVGPLWLLHRRKYVKEIVSLLVFAAFVLLLVLNRLTYNFPVPFFGTSAMERMFLWTTPLFPVFISLGAVSVISALMRVLDTRQFRWVIFFFLLFLFIVPSVGVAYDMISDEANFYVDSSNLEDFGWMNGRFTNVTILNSCYEDSAQWIPFFTSNSVVFSRMNRCRVGNITPEDAERMVKLGLRPFNATLAYIDTNYPSLDPLLFYSRYKLLRFNDGNWVFDLTSSDTRNNFEVLASGLRLCKDVISGNMHLDGRYYVYGFWKRYAEIEEFYLLGLDYAWLKGERGDIMFVPCKNYSQVSLRLLSPENEPVNITVIINGKIYPAKVVPGENVLTFNVTLTSNSLNIIEIHKNCDCLFLIEEVRFS